MNRIHQGRVSKVEIPVILSASILFSASDGEKVAKPDEVSPESGARTEVRCRNQNADGQPLGYRLFRIGHSAKPPHHELFQDAVNF